MAYGDMEKVDGLVLGCEKTWSPAKTFAQEFNEFYLLLSALYNEDPERFTNSGVILAYAASGSTTSSAYRVCTASNDQVTCHCFTTGIYQNTQYPLLRMWLMQLKATGSSLRCAAFWSTNQDVADQSAYTGYYKMSFYW